MSRRPAVAVSAPGKVLLAGGYLVLDRAHDGLVFSLSARVCAAALPLDGAGVVRVESPQFPGAAWLYACRLESADAGVRVDQADDGWATEHSAYLLDPDSHPNPFVQTTIAFALSYVACRLGLSPESAVPSIRIVILADNDYYSLPAATDTLSVGGSTADDRPAPSACPGRFARFPTGLAETNKTGLGSSAALVTALTAAILISHLPTPDADLGSVAGRRRLHNLAQAAHCAAQGKVGSGFDVAAAVHGSCTYRRFSPSVLAGLAGPGAAGFAAALRAVVDNAVWDVEIDTRMARLPAGVTLRMCDVDAGSATVGMVKRVLAWRAAAPADAATLWAQLQARNDALASTLRRADLLGLPGALAAVRALTRDMGCRAAVPIEPPPQSRLLDGLAAVDGVYGGVVPGAGGFDALALLVRDDAAAVDAAVAWLRQSASGARLLSVRGEADGVREEPLALFDGWL